MQRLLSLIIVALVLPVLLIGELSPAFAAGSHTLAPVEDVPAQASEDDTVLVAQLFGRSRQQQQQQPRRRSLLDMLFGDDEEQVQPRRQQQQQQQVQQPKKKKRAAPKEAALPPAKPAVTKAPNATRIAVMGDSLATDVAKGLERFYAEDPNVAIVPMGVGSSSFVRPDHFDWQKTIDEEIAKNSFDIAVVIIGINDRQSLKVEGESYKSLTEGWTQQYRTRLNEFVGKLRAANKPLIWIGLPPMSDGTFSQAMNQISNLQRLAVFAGGGELVDIYDRFLDEEGKYSSFGPDLSGQRVRMRRDDGIHFANAGADKLAFYLSQSIKLFHRGGGSVGFDVADPLTGTDAQLMMRPLYQGLGQMQLLEVAGAVIPLTQTPKRAADLLTPVALAPEDAPFDLNLLIHAPAGRADSFGLGTQPQQNLSGR